ELELDRLVLPDRLPEGLAHLAVGDRLVERRLRKADAAGGDIDASKLEPAQRVFEAEPFLAADQAIGGNDVVFEHELGGVDALVAPPLPLSGDPIALAPFPRGP